MKFIIEDIASVYEYESERLGWKTDGDRKFHILSYQLTGSYDHTVDGRVISVSSDSLFFINKKDPYTVKCRERGRSLCVSFSGETDLPTEAYSVKENPSVKMIFEQIMRKGALSSHGDKYLVVAKIYELISFISSKEEGERHGTDARMQRIKRHLGENYKRADFYAEELTEIAGVGKAQLRKLFKKEYGTTPTQYLIEMRMDTARSLLDEGNMSISEISAYVGYEDVFYFSRLFKKRYGTSPREYKRS